MTPANSGSVSDQAGFFSMLNSSDVINRDFLKPTGLEEDRDLDAVLAWLNGSVGMKHINLRAYPDKALQKAVWQAILEITTTLDPELERLESVAEVAGSGTQITLNDFFKDRFPHWDELSYDKVHSLTQDEAVNFLQWARAEIKWERSEISRFKAHIAANTYVRRLQGRRTSFAYTPTPRTVERFSPDEHHDWD